MNIKNETKQKLLNDLSFARFYGMICGLTVEYYDEHDFEMTKEQAQERVDGCLEIIAKIVFEIRRRNENL